MPHDTRRLWMVRAGERSVLAGEFEKNGCVAIGWTEAGDFTSLNTPEALRERIEAAYANDSPQARNIDFGQTNKFRNVMQPGDAVVTYDGLRREYLLGTITGDYEYREGIIRGSSHLRSVNWSGRIPKDVLRKKSQNTLGAILTIFDPGEAVLRDLEDALKTGRKATPDSVSAAKLDLTTLFAEFQLDYLTTDEGKEHARQYTVAVTSGAENFAEVVTAAAKGEDVTDLVLTKLLPHSNTKRHRESGEWIHVAPAVTKDVRSWFEGAGWATPDQWANKAGLILAFIRSAIDQPGELETACATFAASPYSKGLQCGMLTPILNALRPSEYAILNSKVEKTFEALTGEDIGRDLEDYPETNRRLFNFVGSNDAVFRQAHAFGISSMHAFDMLCHWFVAVRDDGPAPSPSLKTIDRESASSARQVLETICPDGAPRAAALGQLARSIDFAHKLAPGAWSVTLKRHVVRLNVGGAMAFDIQDRGIYIVLHEPSIDVESRNQLEGYAEDEFRYLEGAEGYAIPFSELDPAMSLARPSHEELLRRVIEKSSKAPFKIAHSPGVLRYLRELGLEVPDPGYYDKKPSAVREPATKPGIVSGIYDSPAKHPLYSFDEAAEETNISSGQLERWVRAINRKGQAILYGPPGTGKSFVAERLARILLSGGDGHSDFVQFHSAYSYEDFIQGIRPESTNGAVGFRMMAGRFMEFCSAAAKSSGTSVLIIDEINRANLSNVFGELMYLLEYRDRSLPLAGGGRLSIPPTVRIIGTMNTADRSIALVDHALRRRFAFINLSPDFGVLARFHESKNRDVSGLIEVVRQLNQRIADPHYSVGISFFLRENLAEDLEAIWTNEIEPYIEELFFDRSAETDKFRWTEVKERIAVSENT